MRPALSPPLVSNLSWLPKPVDSFEDVPTWCELAEWLERLRSTTKLGESSRALQYALAQIESIAYLRARELTSEPTAPKQSPPAAQLLEMQEELRALEMLVTRYRRMARLLQQTTGDLVRAEAQTCMHFTLGNSFLMR